LIFDPAATQPWNRQPEIESGKTQAAITSSSFFNPTK
jgi:hypothetical protein